MRSNSPSSPGLAGACVLAVALNGSAAWAAPADFPHPSPRNASYTIEVALDDDNRTLTGSQVVTWRNTQDQPTDELWFHLYWNAWRNDRSTWMLEDRLRGSSDRGDAVRETDWGWIEVDAARWLPGPAADGDPTAATTHDLTSRMRFESPDDGNPHDRTVLVVSLPAPVQPGETVRLELDWRARVPRTFARTGHRGSYYFLAHWFPALGVYETGGWNCHQFHAATEFYSDYGAYDVRMTVPEEFVLGASGRRLDLIDNGDGTATHRYAEDDIHTFTWTTSPTYVAKESVFEEPGLPPVEMRLLLQPEHLGQMERHFTATRAALKYYGTWYGPYPYGHVTVVDPAYGSGAGGMEYPTIFTCGTRLFSPFGGDSPESVTIHEAGHQFWYGLVGNNEFEHAWLDEGLNTFSTIRTLETAYGPQYLVKRYLGTPESGGGVGAGFLPWMFDDLEVPRWQRRLDSLRATQVSDDPATSTYLYHPKTAADISYSKTALWLVTLERYLGWEVLQRILSTFFERYRYRHPSPEDFFAVADEVSGRDLSWFFDQVHHDSLAFDYAIDSVASFPADVTGLVLRDGELVYVEPAEPEDEAEGEDERIFRTEVVVQRRGPGVFPVEVLLVFQDGHEQRVQWSGQEHWKNIIVERGSKLRHAIVDPERKLMLDPNVTNNSRVLKPEAALPARKWGGKWMLWLQDFMSTMSFFI